MAGSRSGPPGKSTVRGGRTATAAFGPGAPLQALALAHCVANTGQKLVNVQSDQDTGGRDRDVLRRSHAAELLVEIEPTAPRPRTRTPRTKIARTRDRVEQ
jgi:hypothetical protein